MKLAAEKQREIHISSNEVNDKWIKDYVDRETAGATQRVQDAEAVIGQEQEDIVTAENAGLMTRESEK
jgi:hypothetical protein